MVITMINGKVINSIRLTFFSNMCVCDIKATEMNHLESGLEKETSDHDTFSHFSLLLTVY